MSQGVIVLVVIALIITYIVARTRRRMGLLVTPRTWLAVMAAVVTRRARPVGGPHALTRGSELQQSIRPEATA